ncbi:MAG: transposase [Planctomycetes bacterium]|nr:transposase [Planctomycetota bacterium]
MKHNSALHHRRSIRLKGYDYSQNGAYFVTICTRNKESLFGNVTDGKMQLEKAGLLVESLWLETATIRNDISLDEYVVMPNHIHGIIIINRRGTLQRAPTQESFGSPTLDSIPTIIRLFKSTVTKQINIIRHTPRSPVWQRGYYEHVIRNRQSLAKIRKYIINNPLTWDLDKENPFYIEENGITKRARVS